MYNNWFPIENSTKIEIFSRADFDLLFPRRRIESDRFFSPMAL